jgi:hypothetical protein
MSEHDPLGEAEALFASVDLFSITRDDDGWELTTHQRTGTEHWHGNGKTLREAYDDLVAEKARDKAAWSLGPRFVADGEPSQADNAAAPPVAADEPEDIEDVFDRIVAERDGSEHFRQALLDRLDRAYAEIRAYVLSASERSVARALSMSTDEDAIVHIIDLVEARR